MRAFELKLPDLGEGLTDATLIRWLVNRGDTVAKNQTLAEVETAKAVVEIPAPRAGYIVRLAGEPGQTIAVGTLLAVIGDGPQDDSSVSEDGPISSASAPTASGDSRPVGIVSGPDIGRATPGMKATLAVRKLAKDLGLDLASLTGSGAHGQILAADVERAARQGHSRPLTPIRRTIARALTSAWAVPQVTAWALAPARGFLAYAKAQQRSIEAVLTSALLPVLDDFADFSAHFDGVLLRSDGQHHIGFAVDAPGGLIVAVLRNAGSLAEAEIAEQTRQLLESGRAGKLTTDLMTGQTFTISNIGAVGGRYGTAIVPLNTTAMLSIGRAADEVRPVNGAVTIQQMFPIALSFDHRVIDGAAAQRFLTRVCDAIGRVGMHANSLPGARS
jgi:2-oxoisovalerate dehydrogenase E2 component (dihydrolipoyl transacylase)